MTPLTLILVCIYFFLTTTDNCKEEDGKGSLMWNWITSRKKILPRSTIRSLPAAPHIESDTEKWIRFTTESHAFAEQYNNPKRRT
jgi:hypothetical protein